MAKDVGTWSDAVAGIVAKFDAGAVTGNNVVFNPVASAALRDLIRDMAKKLDVAVARERAGDSVDLAMKEGRQRYLDRLQPLPLRETR